MAGNDWRAGRDMALAMMIVGSGVVVGKVITAGFPLFMASLLRFALATAALAPWILPKSGLLHRLTAREWGILVVMSLAGQVVFTLLLLWGLRLTSPVEAGLITSTTPAAMALMSWIILGESMNARQMAGVGLAVVGVVVIDDPFSLSAAAVGPGRWLGNLLLVLAVLGEAVFLLLRKNIKSPITNLELTTLLSLLGLVMSLPLALYQAVGFDFGGVSILEWSSIIYFGLIYTVVAYVLWFRGVERSSGATAGVYTAVMPLTAAALSYLVLGEDFRWTHLVGGSLVLSAIWLMARASSGATAENRSRRAVEGDQGRKKAKASVSRPKGR